MAKVKVHIKGQFEAEEAAIIRAKDPKAILCDKNSFSFVSFDDKDIVAAGKDELTTYLVAKAKGEKPKPVAKAK